MERPPDGGGISLEGRGRASRARLLWALSRNFPIAYREQIGNMDAAFSSELRVMLVLNPAIMIALAALISSVSAFVWAVRRKP